MADHDDQTEVSVTKTVERNNAAMESADQEIRRLQEARNRSVKVARRARSGLDRLTHRNGSATRNLEGVETPRDF